MVRLVVLGAVLASTAACRETPPVEPGEGEGEGDVVFDFPDPFVVNAAAAGAADVDTAFVGFATTDEIDNVPMAFADDLAGPWRRDGDAMPVLPSWASTEAGYVWAPAVLKRDDHYILYFTARDENTGFQCIGRATAAALRGPYLDESEDPLVCQVIEPEALCGSIDTSVIVDDNDDAWLLWKSDENAPDCAADSRLWSQRLSADGLRLVGDRQVLLTHDADWETPLIEGPAMVQIADRDFILFYSANRWETADYATGFARCASPAGPCTKVTTTAPWLSSTAGPGGPEVVRDGAGAPVLTFHAWTGPDATGVRMIRALPLDVDALR